MNEHEYEITTATCELCTIEYFGEQSEKLHDMPQDYQRSLFINRMLNNAINAKVPCVSIPCSYGNDKHYICARHIKQMLDALEQSGKQEA